MPTFTYRGIDANGARTDGDIVAADKIAALDQIVAKGLTPLDVREGAALAPWWARDISLSGAVRIRAKELEKFFAVFAAMLGAKTPLSRALHFCADIATDRTLKISLQSAITAVEDGASLADALSDQGKQFPERIIVMIRLGEASNSLASVVRRIADMLSVEAALKREVRQAMIYPVILMGMSVFVMGILVFYLAPTLAPVFETANAQPPVIISAMLAIQQTLTQDWLIVLAILGVGIGAIIALRPALSRGWGRFLQILPISRRYISQRETLRFCQTLELMLSSGGQLSDAIKTAAGTAATAPWKALLSDAHTRIQAGATMADAILTSDLIDPVARTILQTGEESDQMLEVLGPTITTIQSQTSQTLSQAVKLLTPALTLIIGVIVGAVILAAISAIMDLNDVVI